MIQNLFCNIKFTYDKNRLKNKFFIKNKKKLKNKLKNQLKK